MYLVVQHLHCSFLFFVDSYDVTDAQWSNVVAVYFVFFVALFKTKSNKYQI